MKGVKRLTASSYEIGDYVAIVPDDHIFDGKDLQNGRVQEFLGNLSDGDISKLIMQDEIIGDYSAFQLPTFRSITTRRYNLKVLRRRKYQFDVDVELKSNAQSRN